MKKIIVFASGGGSNFEALCNAAEAGKFNAKIVLLVASKNGIGAIEKAKKHNIPVYIYDENTVAEVKKYSPDLIALAGYLQKIPDQILDICPVINIHPALLPKFGGKGMYGHHVHEAVLKAGEQFSGPTVHYVNEHYDEGAIIKQTRVPVLAGDTPQTLAARVLEAEHKLLPECVKQILDK